MPSTGAGCSLRNSCPGPQSRGNVTCMPIAAKRLSCSFNGLSKRVTSRPVPLKAGHEPAALSSPAYGFTKCSFWTTIGSRDPSLTSRRVSMKGAGALPPELRANFSLFVHGWPELSISWRHQLPTLAALGFRAVAPDMRGYGRSSVYTQHSDYAQQHIVRDMLELMDSLGRAKAVWVGHDWGSPVVWNLASHHPDRCHAVANLCVPYYTIERGLDHTLALVDRDLYPVNE